MKIYKTQEEIESDIKDGVLCVEDDVTFESSFSITASLKIKGDITAGSVIAWDNTAWNIVPQVRTTKATRAIRDMALPPAATLQVHVLLV